MQWRSAAAEPAPRSHGYRFGFFGVSAAAMARSDLEIAADFVRRWTALAKQRRGRLGREMPVAALQVAALHHADPAIRRFCLFLLDHYANDVSWNTFHRALRDPVASVRELALHGLACERCRSNELCITDVVTDLIDILGADPSAEVRHKTVAALARLADRDSRAGAALARAARNDSDSAIRLVAQRVIDSGDVHVRSRKAALRAAQRATAVESHGQQRQNGGVRTIAAEK